MAYDYGVKAVLFDLDGVLVDACEVHRVALNQALGEVGYTITEEEHYSRYNGRPTRVKLQMLTEQKGFPVELHQQVMDRKQALTLETIPKVIRPNRGTRSLLKVLSDLGLPLACCSNSTRASILAMLEASKIRHLFWTTVANDDCDDLGQKVTPKPAPDMYLMGAYSVGVNISQCVIVEDSPVGIQAAQAAHPRRVVVVKDPSEVNLDLLKYIVGD
jgi:beta-phosphoglucomutase